MLWLTLWDGRDGESHSDLEVVDGPADPGASVDRVVEVSDVDHPHGDADQRDNLEEETYVLLKPFIFTNCPSPLTAVRIVCETRSRWGQRKGRDLISLRRRLKSKK